jgi:hypothetical protein
MSTTYFRAPGGRIEHITADSITTVCGIPAVVGAHFTDKDRGPNAKVRPLCAACRKGGSRTPLRAVRISDDLWIAAQIKAQSEGRTVSDAMREFLTQWVAKKRV